MAKKQYVWAMVLFLIAGLVMAGMVLPVMAGERYKLELGQYQSDVGRYQAVEIVDYKILIIDTAEGHLWLYLAPAFASSSAVLRYEGQVRPDEGGIGTIIESFSAKEKRKGKTE
jgi:hypothetical protein